MFPITWKKTGVFERKWKLSALGLLKAPVLYVSLKGYRTPSVVVNFRTSVSTYTTWETVKLPLCVSVNITQSTNFTTCYSHKVLLFSSLTVLPIYLCRMASCIFTDARSLFAAPCPTLDFRFERFFGRPLSSMNEWGFHTPAMGDGRHQRCRVWPRFHLWATTAKGLL